MTRSWIGRVGVSFLTMAAACSLAWADRLSPDVLSQYRGVWSPDCANRGQPACASWPTASSLSAARSA